VNHTPLLAIVLTGKEIKIESIMDDASEQPGHGRPVCEPLNLSAHGFASRGGFLLVRFL
jgi:hypothetical protein